MNHYRLSLTDVLLMENDDLMTLQYNHYSPVPFTDAMFPTQKFSPDNGGKLLKRRQSNSFINNDGRVIRGKPCNARGCLKRTQSYGFCKSHGGRARCIAIGCEKTSQSNKLCRSHGGGKRCQVDGCVKGSQLKGLCYMCHSTSFSIEHSQAVKEEEYHI